MCHWARSAAAAAAAADVVVAVSAVAAAAAAAAACIQGAPLPALARVLEEVAQERVGRFLWGHPLEGSRQAHKGLGWQAEPAVRGVVANKRFIL